MSQQAVVIEEVGKDLVVRQRPIPEPEKDQVRVQVSVVGLNPHDNACKAKGLFVKDILPTPIGVDILGTVTKLGPGVEKFKVGDTIFGLGDPQRADETGLQEQCILNVNQAALVPSSLSHDEAATVPLNALTSYLALFGPMGFAFPTPDQDRSSTFNSQVILIIGGGSATGKYAIQFCKMLGFGTILTTASKSSEQLLKSLGATHVIDRNLPTEDIEKAVHAIVNDDLIYALDTVGKGPGGQNLGAKLLSSTKKGILVVLVLLGSVDESAIGEKKGGWERRFVFCAPKACLDVSRPFWDTLLSRWIEQGILKPTTFTVVDGWDTKRINDTLDGYATGRTTSKIHIHL